MDPIRRKILQAGAAATAIAAAKGVFAQQGGQAGAAKFFEKGPVRIRYEDTGGSGFPLLVISGGGLNSSAVSASVAKRLNRRVSTSRIMA